MRLALIPLILCAGCVPLSTIPERCIPIAQHAAETTPPTETIPYMFNRVNRYESAFANCAGK